MNSQATLEIEKEKIRVQEPEILVIQTAEMHARGTICGKTLSPADKIARAIMHITSLYGQAIKKARGGWSCGTHMNHVRTALSHKIASTYNDEQLLRFIEACVDCVGGQKSLMDADKDIKDMAADFLSMRPAPLVHPPASWWRQVLEESDDQN